MSPRDGFFSRVRQAVLEGNRAGASAHAATHGGHGPAHAGHAMPERGPVGYQGCGGEPIGKFCEEMTRAGGKTYVAKKSSEVWRIIEDILKQHSAKRILLDKNPLLDRLEIKGRLLEVSCEVCQTNAPELRRRDGFRDPFFQADLGISGVAYLIAETGSLVMATNPNEPRSTSLLPPVHIALAEPRQILPDLFDLFDLFAPGNTPGRPAAPPPSCLTLITGPSKTGDIELKLVTGVHGPGEVHVVICDW